MPSSHCLAKQNHFCQFSDHPCDSIWTFSIRFMSLLSRDTCCILSEHHEIRGGITSLDLLPILLLLQSMVQLNFWSESACCQLTSNFSSTLHLTFLNFMKFIWAYLSNQTRFLWITPIPLSTALLSLVTFENLLWVCSFPLSVINDDIKQFMCLQSHLCTSVLRITVCCQRMRSDSESRPRTSLVPCPVCTVKGHSEIRMITQVKLNAHSSGMLIFAV